MKQQWQPIMLFRDSGNTLVTKNQIVVFKKREEVRNSAVEFELTFKGKSAKKLYAALDKLKVAYDAVPELKIEQKIRKQIILK